MKVKILGCHGSELPGLKLSSYLINNALLLDAGSLTATLSFEDQKKIKNILITHSHLDHIKDIAFLADNIQESPPTPINIISTEEIINIIRNNLLNNKLWPDFTRLPSEEKPVLAYKTIRINEKVKIDNLEVEAIGGNHVVPTVGYLIADQNASVLFTADTGPTQAIWETANRAKNLKAIFIDTTFPTNQQTLADKSKHLTPQNLKEELKKLTVPAAVYSYHQKGRFRQEIQKEIKFCCPQVKILKEGEILTF